MNQNNKVEIGSKLRETQAANKLIREDLYIINKKHLHPLKVIVVLKTIESISKIEVITRGNNNQETNIAKRTVITKEDHQRSNKM